MHFFFLGFFSPTLFLFLTFFSGFPAGFFSKRDEPNFQLLFFILCSLGISSPGLYPFLLFFVTGGRLACGYNWERSLHPLLTPLFLKFWNPRIGFSSGRFQFLWSNHRRFFIPIWSYLTLIHTYAVFSIRQSLGVVCHFLAIINFFCTNFSFWAGTLACRCSFET